ncbi:hypothetical protein LJR009_000166 [Bosea sp. LjRoot9]|uniref:hypothetical protein n=1 Tax=Bosea sp. LjRoot9 TaxID=3342341 RepID=UPI003ECF9C16
MLWIPTMLAIALTHVVSSLIGWWNEIGACWWHDGSKARHGHSVHAAAANS